MMSDERLESLVVYLFVFGLVLVVCSFFLYSAHVDEWSLRNFTVYEQGKKLFGLYLKDIFGFVFFFVVVFFLINLKSDYGT